jgi:hypothetical protein
VSDEQVSDATVDKLMECAGRWASDRDALKWAARVLHNDGINPALAPLISFSVGQMIRRHLYLTRREAGEVE